jgi:hypothetical protein
VLLTALSFLLTTTLSDPLFGGVLARWRRSPVQRVPCAAHAPITRSSPGSQKAPSYRVLSPDELPQGRQALRSPVSPKGLAGSGGQIGSAQFVVLVRTRRYCCDVSSWHAKPQLVHRA